MSASRVCTGCMTHFATGISSNARSLIGIDLSGEDQAVSAVKAGASAAKAALGV